MCVCLLHLSQLELFFPDCVCGIALIAMNNSSAVPSICLHIFPTIINLLYQLITFQSEDHFSYRPDFSAEMVMKLKG